MEWKDLIVESKVIPLAEVTFNPRNYRIHPKQQYQAMVETMGEVGGWVKRILINKRTGNLVDGHLRVLVAERNNETEIPADFIDVDEETELKILRTLDPLTEMAGTDKGKLQWLEQHAGIKSEALKEILARDASRKGVDSTDEDIDIIIPQDKHAELVEKWKTEKGQLWQLGRHRLLCADATKEDNWKTLMRGELGHMVFTDPPYGVDYTSVKTGSIQGDDLKDNKLVKMIGDVMKMAMKHTEPEAAFYIWHATSTRRDFEYMLDHVALEEKQYIIWVKDHFTQSWADYQWQIEPCFYCQKYGEKSRFYGSRGQSTVWQVMRVPDEEASLSIANGLKISDGEHQPIYIYNQPAKKKLRHMRLNKDSHVNITVPGEGDAWQVARKERGEEYYHPTQKPTELGQIGIINSSLPEQIVLDPFLGGGMTLLASEGTARRCYAMDIDPKFVAVVLERWSTRTGENPTLMSTKTVNKEVNKEGKKE